MGKSGKQFKDRTLERRRDRNRKRGFQGRPKRDKNNRRKAA